MDLQSENWSEEGASMGIMIRLELSVGLDDLKKEHSREAPQPLEVFSNVGPN